MGGTPEPPSAEVCNASLTLTGSRTIEGTPPAEGGCYPLGIWTVNVALSDQGDCANAPAFDAQYIYNITQLLDDNGDPAGFNVAFPADPANEREVILKINGDGAGCSGSFEHWSADGTQLLILKPYTEDDNDPGTPNSDPISGNADFTLYTTNQLGE